MDVKDFESWCTDDEVVVQFRPDIGYVQCGRDQDGCTVIIPREDPTTKKVGWIQTPFLSGRLRIVGSLLELRYRQGERIWVIVGIDPKDVQHVTRTEQSSIIT